MRRDFRAFSSYGCDIYAAVLASADRVPIRKYSNNTQPPHDCGRKRGSRVGPGHREGVSRQVFHSTGRGGGVIECRGDRGDFGILLQRIAARLRWRIQGIAPFSLEDLKINYVSVYYEVQFMRFRLETRMRIGSCVGVCDRSRMWRGHGLCPIRRAAVQPRHDRRSGLGKESRRLVRRRNYRTAEGAADGGRRLSESHRYRFRRARQSSGYRSGGHRAVSRSSIAHGIQRDGRTTGRMAGACGPRGNEWRISDWRRPTSACWRRD